MSNPFDQFDAPASVQQQAPQPIPQATQAAPAPQVPQAPQAAAQTNPFDAFDGHDHAPIPAPTATAPEAPQPPASSGDAEAWRSELSGLINGGASKDQIGAAAMRHGIQVGQLQGLDQALAYRSAHHSAPIAVGIKTPLQPETHDVHGPDRGRLDSLAAGALDTLSMGAGDEIGAVSCCRFRGHRDKVFSEPEGDNATTEV